MSSVISLDQLKQAVPAAVKKSVTQELVDHIDKITTDPEFREAYRENLLGYVNVMAQGKFKVQGYVDAVRYVSYKLMGSTNISAYSRTFPDKIQRFTNDGVAAKDIASYVTAYNKSKLVNLIYEQTLVPAYVLNQDKYQQALNVQVDLMLNANSEKVRTDAANSVLTHLKRPETQKVELDIGIKEDKTIQELRNTTMALVAQQKEMIRAGAMEAQQVAHSRLIIEGTSERVE